MEFLIPAIASIVVALITTLVAGRFAVRASQNTNESEEERLSFDAVVRDLEKRLDSLDVEVKQCHQERDDLGDQVRGMEAANAALRLDVTYLTRRVKDLER